MAAPDFTAWWERLRKGDGAGLEPHELAVRLRRRLRAIKRDAVGVFLDQALATLLQESHSYGVALFLLEGMTERTVLDAYARHLRPLPGQQSDDEEAHLADLMRILAAADDDALVPVVETYLLERAIGVAWPTVPWALWPHHRALFARGWRRFFTESDSGGRADPLVVKSFLAEPEAVQLVRQTLADDDDEAWTTFRDALRSGVETASWLTSEQRAALERAVT